MAEENSSDRLGRDQQTNGRHRAHVGTRDGKFIVYCVLRKLILRAQVLSAGNNISFSGK